MMPDELTRLAASSLRDLYARREVSPLEVTRACLNRIDRLNKAVNAFVFVDADGALASARESEQRWYDGTHLGPLDGVPITIKDLLLLAGHPTRRGSSLPTLERRWDEDAPASRRLRESGAVFLGKTTTPEFGWKGVTDSRAHGVTANPWNATLTAGGSSGGSAAAVALGMGPISIGTDGGGSVRIPASFSGIFALKPTYGRVPTYPATAFGNLSHVGPMTRSVEDAAICLDVIGQPDPRDWSAADAPRGSFRSALADGVGGLRVGFSPDLGYGQVDGDVAGVVHQALQRLETLVPIDIVPPIFEDPVDAFHVLWYSGAAAVLRSWDSAQRASIDPGLLEIAEEGAALSAFDYVQATTLRAQLGQLMGAFHKDYDILLTPTMPITAFAGGNEVPPGSPFTRWTGWCPFTYPFNLTQQPAASLPCGRTNAGLPVGLQIVGPRFRDDLVLRVAHAFEQTLGSLEWPPLAAH